MKKDEMAVFGHEKPISMYGLYTNKENFKDQAFQPPLRKFSYSQAEIIDHTFDIGRKKESWSINETIQKLYDLDNNMSRRMFLDEYFTFMKKRGEVVTKVPVVAKKPLDIYRLYNAVQSFGGYAQVVKKRKWSRVVRDLGLPPSITSAAYTLRTQYLKLLYHFECEKNGVIVNDLFLCEEQESIENIRKLGVWSPEPAGQKESFKRYNSNDHQQYNNSMVVVMEEENMKAMVKNEEQQTQVDASESNIVDTDVTSVIMTPTYMKRSKSEEIYRKNSFDGAGYLNTRSESFDDLYQSNIGRKRTHSYVSDGETRTRHHAMATDDTESNMPSPKRSHQAAASPKSNDNLPHRRSRSPTPKSNGQDRYYNGYVDVDLEEQHRRLTKEQMLYDRPYKNEPSNVKDKRPSMNYAGYVDHPSPQSQRKHQYSPYHPANGHSNETQRPCDCDDCGIKARYPVNAPKQQSPYSNSSSSPQGRTSATPHIQNAQVPSLNDANSLHQQRRKDYEQQVRRIFSKDLPTGFEHQYKPYRRDYRTSHPVRNGVKLSTNPTEMNLKIKERTENALVLSIVVDGIYYSGTLLTSIKR